MGISFSFGAGAPRVSVLMVCTANICRSPLAHGLLAHSITERGLGKYILVDSAGTQVGMKGQRPDPRAQAVAQQAGVDISRLKARKLEARDIERFHYLLAMDAEHLQTLKEMCPEEQQHKLALIMDFASRNSSQISSKNSSRNSSQNSSQNSSRNSSQNSFQNKETEIPDPDVPGKMMKLEILVGTVLEDQANSNSNNPNGRIRLVQ